MRVVLSSAAELDLREIGFYIGARNPARGRSFVWELGAKARALGELPYGFPVVPELSRREIRCRTHGSYLILYRVEPDRILVARIVHGARDYVTLLSND